MKGQSEKGWLYSAELQIKTEWPEMIRCWQSSVINKPWRGDLRTEGDTGRERGCCRVKLWDIYFFMLCSFFFENSGSCIRCNWIGNFTGCHDFTCTVMFILNGLDCATRISFSQAWVISNIFKSYNHGYLRSPTDDMSASLTGYIKHKSDRLQ